jgi:hypothetical protein
MKPSRLLASLVLLVSCAAVAQAQNGCARLSWGTCDPQKQDSGLLGPQTSYTLIESVFGVSAQNVGTDSEIRITNLAEPGGWVEPVPDSWRFDDAGCQAGRLTWTNNPLSKVCPAFKGFNPSAFVHYFIIPDGTALLRLTSSYDAFAPLPSSRYTLWQLTFDFSQASIGPTPPDHSTCGGLELCENISFDFVQVLGSDGSARPLIACDPAPSGVCAEATFNGGCIILHRDCSGPVPTEAETWGKLKGLYR